MNKQEAIEQGAKEALRKTPKEIAQAAWDNGHNPVFLTAFLNLIMCSDPWPVDEENMKIITDKADEWSRGLGFSCWIEAYHGLNS